MTFIRSRKDILLIIIPWRVNSNILFLKRHLATHAHYYHYFTLNQISIQLCMWSILDGVMFSYWTEHISMSATRNDSWSNCSYSYFCCFIWCKRCNQRHRIENNLLPSLLKNFLYKQSSSQENFSFNKKSRQFL